MAGAIRLCFLYLETPVRRNCEMLDLGAHTGRARPRSPSVGTILVFVLLLLEHGSQLIDAAHLGQRGELLTWRGCETRQERVDLLTAASCLELSSQSFPQPGGGLNAEIADCRCFCRAVPVNLKQEKRHSN